MPATHIQLLVSIGRKYQLQHQDASALRVLEEAYKLSRNVTDRSTRARAACDEGLLRLPALPCLNYAFPTKASVASK